MKVCFYNVVFCLLITVFSLHAAQAQLMPNVHPNNTTCGQNNGSAEAYPTGGVGGYTYAWSIAGIPNTQDSVSGLIAGNYQVTVYSGGTSAVQAFVISASASPITVNQVVQPTCGLNNGSLNFTTTFSSNFQTTLLRNDTVVEQGTQTQFTNLQPGTYAFIASSPGAPCSPDTIIEVLSDNSTIPVISNVTVTPDACFGNNNGAITVAVANCAGGCTYSWSGMPTNTTTSATALPAGRDTFIVTEGCAHIDTIITVPGPLAQLTGSLTTSASNCGQTNGIAIDPVTGGTAPYTYQWSAGTPVGDSATNLPGSSPIYVTVTDSHGCTVIDTGAIGSVPKPQVAVTPPDTICAGDNTGLIVVTPISGDAPFSYIWSNFESTNVNAGLSPGLYSLTVTDAVGCDTIVQVVVPSYSGQISANYIGGGDVGSTVEIELNVNVPVTNVQWSPYIPGSEGSLNVAFKPLQDSVYTVIVTYGKGCKLYDTLAVNVYYYNAGWVIPNTFTPNGDGINDNFKLITSPDLSSFHIWIFDRWGSKVFESTQVDFLWNGTDQFVGQKPFNSGVFSYVIEYQSLVSGSSGKIGGNITLVK
jgi:gliding motility-associated-like protein